jgi:putative hydrolase of the HAD superfamily
LKALWTDFGGVLTVPGPELTIAYCERIGVLPEMLAGAMWAVAQAYGADDPMEPLDTPLVDEREWGALVERELYDRFGVRADVSNFGERWLDGQPGNGEWVDYLGSLRARGYFVGMVSNMMPSFDPHWRRIAPPEELFDDLILSCEVGARKPQRAIFELAARRADAAPRECVLVDDLEPHCAAARAAGWDAVHFTSAPAAIEQVERLLSV